MMTNLDQQRDKSVEKGGWRKGKSITATGWGGLRLREWPSGLASMCKLARAPLPRFRTVSANRLEHIIPKIRRKMGFELLNKWNRVVLVFLVWLEAGICCIVNLMEICYRLVQLE